MIIAQASTSPGNLLSEQEITAALSKGLSGRFNHQRVLVLIPDHTRSLPLPFLFRTLLDVLNISQVQAGTGAPSQLDFMVALGTHPPLPEEALNKLVGITAAERATTYRHVGLFNHAWNDPGALISLGTMEADEIRMIAGKNWHASLPNRVEIRINKAVREYDHILILGPTFPHEVVGFSGGAKYLFPGISGPEMINATHWLGALAGVVGTIGLKETPVRAMIQAAAGRLKTPLTLAALVVDGHIPSPGGGQSLPQGEPGLAGIFIGDVPDAWEAAADLSAQRNVIWCEKPIQRVLSCAPTMYDELWTAAKAMYKLEPAVAMGGEVIIYAPHLEVVSHVHGKYIYEIGYHILPYFLEDWGRFKNIPLGVLAHSTHVRGSGVMAKGIEKPNVQVTLASKIPAEDCARLNLGYLDPASVNIKDWMDGEDRGILCVPRAGEKLYRVQSRP